MPEPKRILIVGGGYTGLTAAWHLSRQPGLTVSLVEQSADLGGLAGGFRLEGTSIEKTYHHLFRTDTDILQLVEELGVADRLEWLDSSLGIYLDGEVFPFMSPQDLLRFRPCGLFSRIRLGVIALYLQKRKNWRPLAHQTAYQWMQRACGRDAMRAVWDPLLKGKFDRYHDRVSMAWLWARIHVRANSRRSGSREQLGYFKGGFDVVTQALVRELARRHVTIRTRTPAERFDGKERKLCIAGQWEPFDACIFTGPSATFARMLPEDSAGDGYARQLQSIEYLGAVCLVFTSDQAIGDQYWLNVNEPGAPFLVFLRHTRLVDPARYGGKQVYYLGAYVPQDSPLFARADAQIAADWWAYVRKIYPAFDPARVQERHVFKFRNAQHIVETDYESRIPAYRTPLPGVFLANFSQIFPEDRGTNYAVREGRKLAGMVVKELLKPLQP